MKKEEGVKLTDEQRRRRRSRSIAIALTAAALVLIFYAVTIVKYRNNMEQRAATEQSQ